MNWTLTAGRSIFYSAVRRAMKVIAIAALSDNYMYLLVDSNKKAAIVDPVDLKAVIPLCFSCTSLCFFTILKACILLSKTEVVLSLKLCP